MEKIRLGLIGLGYIGKIHLRHCQKIANAKLVAVADLSKKALKTAKQVGVKKLYTNYEELLKDHDIDAVIIALPTYLHLKCAKETAENQKHILLEKPIARNVAEAREIIAAAQKHSIKLMRGYPMRFATEFQQLKQKMNEGVLGDVEIAQATYISSGPLFHRAEGLTPTPVPEWWFNKELTGGGALIDIGSHLINILRWYFGEITDIKSHLSYRFNMPFEDSAICLAKFEKNTEAIITVGWFSQDYQLNIELYGTVKRIQTQHKPLNKLLAAIQMLTIGSTKFYNAHKAELQHFVDCLIKDKQPTPTGEDGLKDLEVIEKAYKNQIVLQ
jgi:predicted dehydrogenase